MENINLKDLKCYHDGKFSCRIITILYLYESFFVTLQLYEFQFLERLILDIDS